jgi:hypothetical protein
MCGTASRAAEPAPAVTVEAPTTPPPGSRERQAILDGLRTELIHLTGPDLFFVVSDLRVLAGWAWIEAAPQSRDGANRYEDVVALLRQQAGRWVVQVLGPCGESEDPDADCNADTGRLRERFPSLPPDLLPHDDAPAVRRVP